MILEDELWASRPSDVNKLSVSLLTFFIQQYEQEIFKVKAYFIKQRDSKENFVCKKLIVVPVFVSKKVLTDPY